MRSLEKNKRKMWYSVLEETENVTEQETYTDKKGVVHTIGTGTKKALYSNPVEFRANFQQQTGYAEAMEFGINLEDYSASITTTDDIGISETSLIWVYNEVKYNKVSKTIDGQTVQVDIVDETSADYKVIKVSKNLNQFKYILKKRVENK